APECIPRRHGTSARRDSLQRRILHPGDLPPAGGRRGRALVRPPSGDLREPRPGPGRGHRRGVLFLCPLPGQWHPGARRIAERLVPVKLGARLTEVGTLETWCESKVSDNRWRLQFELRKAAAEPVQRKPAAVISEEAAAQALEITRAVFSSNAKTPIPPEELPAKLYQAMGLGRNSAPLASIRRLA